MSTPYVLSKISNIQKVSKNQLNPLGAMWLSAYGARSKFPTNSSNDIDQPKIETEYEIWHNPLNTKNSIEQPIILLQSHKGEINGLITPLPSNTCTINQLD